MRKVEAIHIPGTTGNPREADNLTIVEDNLQWVHYVVQAVDNCALEVCNPEADIQGEMDMVGMQVEREALPMDVRPGSQKRARDKAFGDQRVFLEQYR